MQEVCAFDFFLMSGLVFLRILLKNGRMERVILVDVAPYSARLPSELARKCRLAEFLLLNCLGGL